MGPALEFMRQLWRLNHALERVSSQMGQRLGITAQQRMVLRCIGKLPGMTASMLATQLHLDPGTISVTLSRLEGRQLIERRKDQKDRRRVSLFLTAAGEALDVPSEGTVESTVERLLTSTDPTALNMTAVVLGSLTRLLEEATPEEE
jgi:DNA-binding MarR family transcriptional regulator